MAKKKECDRCGWDFFKSDLTYVKGFYFCNGCMDKDAFDSDAVLTGPNLNINPYLDYTPAANIQRGYGYNYGKWYGDGL